MCRLARTPRLLARCREDALASLSLADGAALPARVLAVDRALALIEQAARDARAHAAGAGAAASTGKSAEEAAFKKERALALIQRTVREAYGLGSGSSTQTGVLGPVDKRFHLKRPAAEMFDAVMKAAREKQAVRMAQRPGRPRRTVQEASEAGDTARLAAAAAGAEAGGRDYDNDDNQRPRPRQRRRRAEKAVRVKVAKKEEQQQEEAVDEAAGMAEAEAAAVARAIEELAK